MNGQITLVLFGLAWTLGLASMVLVSEGQPSLYQRNYFSVFAQLSRKNFDKADVHQDLAQSQIDYSPTVAISIGSRSSSDSQADPKSRIDGTEFPSSIYHMRIIRSKPKILVEDVMGNRYTILPLETLPQHVKLLYVLKRQEKWYVVTTSGVRPVTPSD